MEAPLITAVTIARQVEGGQLGGREYYNGKNIIYKNITGIPITKKNITLQK